MGPWKAQVGTGQVVRCLRCRAHSLPAQHPCSCTNATPVDCQPHALFLGTSLSFGLSSPNQFRPFLADSSPSHR